MGRKILIILIMAFCSFGFAENMAERGMEDKQQEHQRREKHIIRKLKKHFPEVVKIMEEAKDNDPELFREYHDNLKTPAFMQTFHMAGPMFHKEKMKDNLGLVKNIILSELKSIKLGRDIRKGAKESDELRKLLNDIFNMKEQLQAIALKHMEERLEKLRDLTFQRKNMREKIIEQRLKELTEDNETLRW